MRAPAAALAALTLAACASTGAPAEVVSFAGGAVTVPVARGFEVTQRSSAGEAVESLTLRRPSPVRGSFEECTVEVRRAPAGVPASQVAAAAAVHRHRALIRTEGLTGVSIAEGVVPRVVTSDFTLEHTLRTRERYWGLSHPGGAWLVRQSCQTVGSADDLLALEAAAAPAFALHAE
jgi:hypothetical protein